jgi:hypothetical protein
MQVLHFMVKTAESHSAKCPLLPQPQPASQPQAFSQPAGLAQQAGAGAQQAGFAQQAGAGAQQSPLNARLQSATLNSIAPK